MSVGLILVFVVALVLLKKALVFVPRSCGFVVERFGRYSRTLKAGMNMIIPVVEVVQYRVRFSAMKFDGPVKSYLTRDNLEVKFESILEFTVIDAARACYQVADFIAATRALADTLLSKEIEKHPLEYVRSETRQIASQVLAQLQAGVEPWGLSVQRFEIARNSN